MSTKEKVFSSSSGGAVMLEKTVRFLSYMTLFLLCMFTTGTVFAQTPLDYEDDGSGVNTVLIHIPVANQPHDLYYYYYSSYPSYDDGVADPQCNAGMGTETSHYSAYTVYDSFATSTLNGCGSGVYYWTYKDASTTEELYLPYYYNQTTQTITWGVTDGTVLDSSNSCDTSVTNDTRCIIMTDPQSQENVATTTAYTYTIEYNVPNSQAPYSFFGGETVIEVDIVHLVTNIGQTYSFTVDTNGTGTYNGIMDISNSGTYGVTMRMFNEYPLFSGINEISFYQWFTASTSSRPQDIDAIIQQIRDGTVQPYGQDSTGIIGDMIEKVSKPLKSLLDTLIYLPPWGYLTVFISTLNDDTLTYTDATFATTSLLISFPQGSPAENLTLRLDALDGISQAIAQIEAYDNPQTPTGNTLERFLQYWEFLWYLVFIIYMIKHISNVVIELSNVTSSSNRISGKQQSKQFRQVQQNYYNRYK